jgi:hypothetical protein
MVYAGAWCSHTLGLEVMSIGRSPEDNFNALDCVLEMSGRFLAYRITLRGGWALLYAVEMDSPGKFELLINVADGEAGWQKTICPLIKALEKSGSGHFNDRLKLGRVDQMHG